MTPCEKCRAPEDCASMGDCLVSMRRLYDGEKRAGLLDPEQARQDIRDAGRGHLLRD